MICKLNSLARSYNTKRQFIHYDAKRDGAQKATYLQAFYFSLESKDEVFHVAAVKAIFPLLFRGGGALRSRFLIMNCGCQRQSWKPLLGKCDGLFLLAKIFIRVSIVLLLLLLLIVDYDWGLDVLLGDADDAGSFAIDDRCAAAGYDDLILGQNDRRQPDGFWTGDNRWAKHGLGVYSHHIGWARWSVLGMVMVPGHTHGCLRDLTHSEVLKHLLLGRRCHCDRLLLSGATGLHLLIFSGDLLLLHRDSLFHSCRR